MKKKTKTILGDVTYVCNDAFSECISLTFIFCAGSEYTLSYTFPYGTLYCYSEEEQTEGNYWHYVDGVPTVW